MPPMPPPPAARSSSSWRLQQLTQSSPRWTTTARVAAGCFSFSSSSSMRLLPLCHRHQHRCHSATSSSAGVARTLLPSSSLLRPPFSHAPFPCRSAPSLFPSASPSSSTIPLITRAVSVSYPRRAYSHYAEPASEEPTSSAKQQQQPGRDEPAASSPPSDAGADGGGAKKAAGAPRKKVTLQTIARLHREGTPITVMTAHDYPSGLFVERAGIDITLVGDSLAMVALGYDSTNEITLDEMIHHSRAVARGSKTPFLVADLPFGSYELSPEHALASSLRLIKEARGVDAVKLEGGAEMADTVRRIVAVGVPVLGHIGLTPQRASALGGFRVQGTTLEKAKSLLNDALALQASGVFAVVLEAVPSRVAAYITARLAVPTIGIGAGPRCSGQVLVQLDALGVYDRLTPKFCKRYADLGQVVPRALREYAEDVREGRFPVEGAHTYSMAKGEEVRFEEWCEAEDRARAEGARTGGGDGERR